MKIAVIVQCHRLTGALEYSVSKFKDRSDVFVLIHVDRKSDMNDFRHLEYSNVAFVSSRVIVNWGSFGQIKSTLKSFEWLRHNNIEFDYVSVISGDDVLLHSVEDFLGFLHKNRGVEFIGVQKSGNKFYDPSERVLYRYPRFCFNKNINVKRRVLLLIFRVSRFFGFYRNKYFNDLPRCYKGSSWFTITSEAMMYVLKFLEKNKNYELAYCDSFCADEVFFQTILVNSLYRVNINHINCLDIDDNEASLRYIDWSTGPDYPRSLDLNDVKCAKEGTLFFARKISDTISRCDLKNILG